MSSEVKTLSIPEAGGRYLGLSRNGSYSAADRGEIPFIRVGRLKRVPVVLMERMLEAAAVPSKPHEA
jgi:excisionase family DNA binding protein